jgi:putative flippase GtrA
MSFVGQAMRFAITGILITAIGYVSIVGLTTTFRLNPYIANFLVYAAGLFFSYWLNARFVFRGRKQMKSFVKFLFSFVVAYLANLAFLACALKLMLLSLWISQLLSIAVHAAVHFMLSRNYVFKRTPLIRGAIQTRQ